MQFSYVRTCGKLPIATVWADRRKQAKTRDAFVVHMCLCNYQQQLELQGAHEAADVRLKEGTITECVEEAKAAVEEALEALVLTDDHMRRDALREIGRMKGQYDLLAEPRV